MSFYGSIYANPSAVYDNTKTIEAEVENRKLAISELTLACQTKDNELNDKIEKEINDRIAAIMNERKYTDQAIINEKVALEIAISNEKVARELDIKIEKETRERAIEALNDEISNVQEKVQENADAINNINETIGITSGSENSLIDLINANVDNITDIKDAIGDDLSYYDENTITKRFNDIADNFLTLNNVIGEFSGSVSDLSGRVENLENSSGGGEVDSELVALVETNTLNIEKIVSSLGIPESETESLYSLINTLLTEIIELKVRIGILEGSTITFTIGETEYIAEKNMTWEQWFNNDTYNTKNYYNIYQDATNNFNLLVVEDENYSLYGFTIEGNSVKYNDTIISGGVYTLTEIQVITINEEYIGGNNSRLYLAPRDYTWKNWVNNKSYSEGNYDSMGTSYIVSTKQNESRGYSGYFDVDNIEYPIRDSGLYFTLEEFIP